MLFFNIWYMFIQYYKLNVFRFRGLHNTLNIFYTNNQFPQIFGIIDVLDWINWTYHWINTGLLVFLHPNLFCYKNNLISFIKECLKYIVHIQKKTRWQPIKTITLLVKHNGKTCLLLVDTHAKAMKFRNCKKNIRLLL